MYLPAISSNLALLQANFGSWMWTDARTVVPKFDGQNVKKPKRSWRENGSFLPTSLTAVTSLLYTCGNFSEYWNKCWVNILFPTWFHHRITVRNVILKSRVFVYLGHIYITCLNKSFIRFQDIPSLWWQSAIIVFRHNF